MARWLLAMVVLMGMTGVASAQSQFQSPSFPRAALDVVTADGRHHPFQIEEAVTEAQLFQGLMFRRTLERNTGMLFDFGTPRQVAMWMKNTLVPLDMLFIRADGHIAYIEEYAVPGTLQPRGPAEPVLGVLEVAAGTARRLGLKPGDIVQHPMFNRGR